MNQPIKNWEIEFNKKFLGIHNVRSWIYEQCDCEAPTNKCSTQIKSFISQLLSEATREAVREERERIVNMPAFEALQEYSQLDEDGVMVRISRQAVDEIVNALHPKDPITNPKQ